MRKVKTAASHLSKLSLGLDQKKAYDLALKGENVHICGAAGTGKSHLITQAFKNVNKVVAVTASTGVAADNLNSSSLDELNATTVHYWMGGIFQGSPMDDARLIAKLPCAERIKGTDVLILDEISMITAELWERIDLTCKHVRNSMNPFGGIQVIPCGDWFQLEPVNTQSKRIQRFRDMDYCFETDCWIQTIRDENVVVLSQNYRQKTDPEFQGLLDDIREGILTESTIKLLKSRVNAELDLPNGMRATHILPLAKQVDEENRKALEEIPGECIIFEISRNLINISQKEGEKFFIKMMKNMGIANKLTLKIGALVMLLANLSIEEGLVNGTQGVVKDFDEEGWPIITFANGVERSILPKRWYSQSNKPTKGSGFSGIYIEALPLKLAFAITIHKSQSITIEFIKLDLGANTFAGGQAYTGLSRCPRLAGLCLTDFHKSAIRVNPKVVAFYRKFSALKHIMIDDGEEGVITKQMIIDLLKKHIPSALAPVESRKRKGAYGMEKTKTKNALKRTDWKDLKNLANNDEECPL